MASVRLFQKQWQLSKQIIDERIGKLKAEREKMVQAIVGNPGVVAFGQEKQVDFRDYNLDCLASAANTHYETIKDSPEVIGKEKFLYKRLLEFINQHMRLISSIDSELKELEEISESFGIAAQEPNGILDSEWYIKFLRGKKLRSPSEL